MIDQILKDRQPDQKPRFFLHDEMKAWLKDNLDIQVTHGQNRSSDFNLQAKLGLSYTLPVGLYLSITIYVDKEPVAIQQFNLPIQEYEQAFKCVANVLETCMQKVSIMQAENAELKRRIELLENANLLPK